MERSRASVLSIIKGHNILLRTFEDRQARAFADAISYRLAHWIDQRLLAQLKAT